MLVKNAGTKRSPDGSVIKERYWCENMTVREAKKIGDDITARVLRWTPPSIDIKK
jgi:hypothetical protein